MPFTLSLPAAYNGVEGVYSNAHFCGMPCLQAWVSSQQSKYGWRSLRTPGEEALGQYLPGALAFLGLLMAEDPNLAKHAAMEKVSDAIEAAGCPDDTRREIISDFESKFNSWQQKACSHETH